MKKSKAFEVLGVNDDSTEQEIRRAFKKLALKLHPDKNRDDEEAAKEKFQELNAAYQRLTNPEQDEVHDDLFETADLSELFNSFFTFHFFNGGSHHRHHVPGFPFEFGEDFGFDDIYEDEEDGYSDSDSELHFFERPDPHPFPCRPPFGGRAHHFHEHFRDSCNQHGSDIFEAHEQTRSNNPKVHKGKKKNKKRQMMREQEARRKAAAHTENDSTKYTKSANAEKQQRRKQQKQEEVHRRVREKQEIQRKNDLAAAKLAEENKEKIAREAEKLRLKKAKAKEAKKKRQQMLKEKKRKEENEAKMKKQRERELSEKKKLDELAKQKEQRMKELQIRKKRAAARQRHLEEEEHRKREEEEQKRKLKLEQIERERKEHAEKQRLIDEKLKENMFEEYNTHRAQRKKGEQRRKQCEKQERKLQENKLNENKLPEKRKRKKLNRVKAQKILKQQQKVRDSTKKKNAQHTLKQQRESEKLKEMEERENVVKQWSCKLCTYENSGFMVECEMCHSPKGTTGPISAAMPARNVNTNSHILPRNPKHSKPLHSQALPQPLQQTYGFQPRDSSAPRQTRQFDAIPDLVGHDLNRVDAIAAPVHNMSQQSGQSLRSRNLGVGPTTSNYSDSDDGALPQERFQHESLSSSSKPAQSRHHIRIQSQHLATKVHANVSTGSFTHQQVPLMTKPEALTEEQAKSENQSVQYEHTHRGRGISKMCSDLNGQEVTPEGNFLFPSRSPSTTDSFSNNQRSRSHCHAQNVNASQTKKATPRESRQRRTPPGFENQAARLLRDKGIVKHLSNQVHSGSVCEQIHANRESNAHPQTSIAQSVPSSNQPASMRVLPVQVPKSMRYPQKTQPLDFETRRMEKGTVFKSQGHIYYDYAHEQNQIFDSQTEQHCSDNIDSIPSDSQPIHLAQQRHDEHTPQADIYHHRQRQQLDSYGRNNNPNSAQPIYYQHQQDTQHLSHQHQESSYSRPLLDQPQPHSHYSHPFSDYQQQMPLKPPNVCAATDHQHSHPMTARTDNVHSHRAANQSQILAEDKQIRQPSHGGFNNCSSQWLGDNIDSGQPQYNRGRQVTHSPHKSRAYGERNVRYPTRSHSQHNDQHQHAHGPNDSNSCSATQSYVEFAAAFRRNAQEQHE